MRYANYSDPYARNASGSVDYSAAVCMRGDMMSGGHGDADGCSDTKVTSYLRGFFNLSAEAVAGPTSVASDGTDGRSGNRPFAWRKDDAQMPHFGTPRKFDFDFITVRAKYLHCSQCEEMHDAVIV